MSCDDITRYTDVYLDNEFCDEDRAEFEAHLAQCSACTQRIEHQRQLRRTIREVLTPISAPAELRERIEAALEAEVSSASAWPVHARRWAPALAVAAALAFVLMFPLSESTESTQVSSTIVNAFTTAPPARRNQTSRVQPVTHSPEFRSLHRMRPDITGDATAIKRFVRERIPATQPPLSTDQAVKLAGAREVTFQGEPAVMYVYKVPSGRIGVIYAPHLQTSTHTVTAPALERRGDLTVGTFTSKRINYAVVSDLELELLVQTLP